MYVSLNRVNSVVDRVGAMTEDQISVTDRDKLVAEARFLRAIINFGLVSSWENVPLMKNETVSLENLEVGQSTPQEVYAFIEEDLIFAKNNLEATQGGGRATKGAAQALLGKVYLQMTGHPINDASYFAKAENELKAVIDSNVYSLVPYYPDIFTQDNEQNNEIIFSFGFDGPGMDQGGRIGTLYGPLGTSINGGASGNNWYVNWELAGPATGPGNTGNWAKGKGGKPRNNHPFAQPYTDDDIRSRNNIAKTHVNKGYMNGAIWPDDAMFGSIRNEWRGNWKPWKWHNIRPSNWGNDAPLDEAYIRYADVLLMYAEALNGQSKLTQADADMTINLLRARARLFPDEVKEETLLPNLTVGTQQYNADEILSERRKELCFEGWRRNDLIRNGVYLEAINSSQPVWSNSGNPQPQYSPFEIRWPIPASELQINSKLVQNEGYN
ncbi:SusD-like protein [Formosa sp. Hel3_A1_48]|nr:SusD-like protein [Formosa sp. Hel3_A1_48]